MWYRLALALLVVGGFATSVKGQHYQPTEIGSVNYYQGLDNPHNYAEWRVEGPVGGNLVFALIENGPLGFGVQGQMAIEPDGDAYWVAESYDDSSTWYYFTPPILTIDSPLSVGQAWNTTGTYAGNEYRMDVEVLAEETLTVPAGTFDTFCVEYTIYINGVNLHSYTTWYAEGVGTVKFDWRSWATSDVYVLRDTIEIPAGDDCTDYGDLSGIELPLLVRGSTVGTNLDFTPFTSSSSEPDCWQGSWYWGCGYGPDVTYKWTVPSDGHYSFTIADSDFYNVLLLYDFTCPVEPVYPFDFICGSHDIHGHTRVTHLELAEGQEILIVVDGYYMASGEYALSIEKVNGAEVAVYADEGAGDACLRAFEHFLDWKDITHGRIGSFAVNYAELSAFYDAIYFPGGTYTPYLSRIKPDGYQHIRNLVVGGGAYIGICAGAFFAADQVIWEGGAVQDFPLDLFSGRAEGALDEIIPWPGATMTQVSLNPRNPINQYEPPAHTTRYAGGPAFIPHAGVEVDTIATYDDCNDSLAIINFTYGSGRVVLFGPHPEFEEDSDRDGTTVGEEYDDEGSEWGLLWTAVDWVLGRPITSPSAAPEGLVHPSVSSARLYPSYPNPFNPRTRIDFSLVKDERAKIRVYDLAGRLVSILADKTYVAGDHSVIWNGKDSAGREVSAGAYIVRLETEERIVSKKVMLVR